MAAPQGGASPRLAFRAQYRQPRSGHPRQGRSGYLQERESNFRAYIYFALSRLGNDLETDRIIRLDKLVQKGVPGRAPIGLSASSSTKYSLYAVCSLPWCTAMAATELAARPADGVEVFVFLLASTPVEGPFAVRAQAKPLRA